MRTGYLLLILVDLACFFGIYAMVKDHPNGSWVLLLVIICGILNQLQGYIKRTDDE